MDDVMDYRKQVASALSRALENDDIKVVMFSGKWGTGKTHLWDLLAQALLQKHKEEKFKSYSYISVFGLEGLEKVKRAIASDWIFSSTTKEKDGGFEKHKPSWLSNKNVTELALKNIPFLDKNYDLGVDLALSKLSEALICFDDMERRSSTFELLPLLGFAELLATKQNCKVVIISNTGSLNDDDQKILEAYHEKVIDRVIEFNPPSSSNAGLICDGTEDFDSDLCKILDQLDVTNLRIIKRIRAYTRELLDASENKFEMLTQLIATSVALIANLQYNKEDNLPDIDFLRNGHMRARVATYKNEEISIEQKGWIEYLARCSWGTFNNYDEVIYDFIVTGILSKPRLNEAIDEMRVEYESGEIQTDTTKVWGMYYDTFEDNESQFLDSLFSTYKKYAAIMSVNNINAAISTLREYGRADAANDLCDHWIQEKLKKDPKMLDANLLHWPNDLTDSVLRSAMAKAHASNKQKIKLPDLLTLIDEDKATVEDWIFALSDVYFGDIENELKNIRSTNVFKRVRKILRFAKYVDTSIGGNANELKIVSALKNIGKGSNINASRVSVMLKDKA